MKPVYTIILITSILFVPVKVCTSEYPISKSELERVSNAARLAGKVMACNLDWKPYYHKFMGIERKKDWDGRQIAFIGFYFGYIQQQTAQKMGTILSKDVDEITKKLQAQMEKLNKIKFSNKPTRQTKLWWYDLGSNGKKKNLRAYPVGEIDHAILVVLFDGEYVKELEVCRAPDQIDHKDFLESAWEKANPEERLTLVHDLIAKGHLNGKSEKDVIKLLDKPNGNYIRKYGYKILIDQNTEKWKNFKHPSGVFSIDVLKEWGKGIQYSQDPNVFSFQPTNTSELTISIAQDLKYMSKDMLIKYVKLMFPKERPISKAKWSKGYAWNSIRQDFEEKKNGRPRIWLVKFYEFGTNIIAITLSDSKENIDNHKLIFEQISDSIAFNYDHLKIPNDNGYCLFPFL